MHKMLKLSEGGNATGGKFHAGILRGKDVQKTPNMYIAGSSTSATFALPVRHGTCECSYMCAHGVSWEYDSMTVCRTKMTWDHHVK